MFKEEYFLLKSNPHHHPSTGSGQRPSSASRRITAAPFVRQPADQVPNYQIIKSKPPIVLACGEDACKVQISIHADIAILLHYHFLHQPFQFSLDHHQIHPISSSSHRQISRIISILYPQWLGMNNFALDVVHQQLARFAFQIRGINEGLSPGSVVENIYDGLLYLWRFSNSYQRVTRTASKGGEVVIGVVGETPVSAFAT